MENSQGIYIEQKNRSLEELERKCHYSESIMLIKLNKLIYSQDCKMSSFRRSKLKKGQNRAKISILSPFLW